MQRTPGGVDRRQFLKLAGSAGVAGTSALAGCTGTVNVIPGGEALGAISQNVDKPLVKGGPNDLQSDVQVSMAALDGNNGNGFAYLPAVVWLEPGGTVSWEHTADGSSQRVSHTVTSMSSGNEKPQYCPTDSKAFDSGVIAGLGPWKHEQALNQPLAAPNVRGKKGGKEKNSVFHGPYELTFEAPDFPEGVYFYMCEDHMGFGMVGAIVVGNVTPDSKGWSPGMTKPMKMMFSKSFKQHMSNVRQLVKQGAQQ